MNKAAEAEWMPCRYFSFWDVPRDLVFTYQNRVFQLSSPFEEELDDYRPDYYVWELEVTSSELVNTLTWQELTARRIKQWKDVSVKTFKFSPFRDKHDHKFFARFHFSEMEPPFMETISSAI